MSALIKPLKLKQAVFMSFLSGHGFSRADELFICHPEATLVAEGSAVLLVPHPFPSFGKGWERICPDSLVAPRRRHFVFRSL
jgi:hypothetical protein